MKFSTTIPQNVTHNCTSAFARGLSGLSFINDYMLKSVSKNISAHALLGSDMFEFMLGYISEGGSEISFTNTFLGREKVTGVLRGDLIVSPNTGIRASVMHDYQATAPEISLSILSAYEKLILGTKWSFDKSMPVMSKEFEALIGLKWENFMAFVTQ